MCVIPRVAVALLLAALLGVPGVASAQTLPPGGQLVTTDDVSQLFGGEWQGTGGQGFGAGEVLGGGVEQPEATGCGTYEPDAGFVCMLKAAGVDEGGPSLLVWIETPDPSADMTLWGWVQSTWGPVDSASESESVVADVVPNVGDEAYLLSGIDLFGSTLAFRAGGVNVGAQFRSASDGPAGVPESAATNALLADLGRIVAARLGQVAGATPFPGSSAEVAELPGSPDGNESAETQPLGYQLVTAEDVAQVLPGEWQGGCVHTSPPAGPSDACTFDGVFGFGAQAQVVLSVGLPVSGETPESWHEQTGLTGENLFFGAGETAYVLWDDTAPVAEPRLLFRSSRAVGQLSYSLQGEIFALQTADLATLAMVQFAAQVADVTAVPGATGQPAPSTDPFATDPLEDIEEPSDSQLQTPEEPRPDGQLVNGDDLSLELHGTWEDPRTCGVDIPDGASYQCQFSGIDGAGDPQTLTIWVNRHEAGDGVSQETWAETIETAWREDIEASPGSETLEEITWVGDAAYLVTGTGDHAGSTLSFYQGPFDVRMEYTVDGPNGDPVSENQNIFLTDLGLVVEERLEMQSAAATDDAGATTEATDEPAPSATLVASPTPLPTAPPASPAPTAPPATPAPVATAAPLPSAASGPASTSSTSSGPLQAPGPSDISLDPVVIATSVVAALGIVLLIPFPSALFNSTLEENYAEIRGWFRFRRRRTTAKGEDEPGPDDDPDGSGPGPSATAGAEAADIAPESAGGDAVEIKGDAVVASATAINTPASAIDRFWATRMGAVTFFAVAGLLYGFLDPTFGMSVDSLLLYVGILAALAVGSVASMAAIRWAREQLNGERGSFRVLPATLLVALVCVLVTRITDFQPGYLYGVLAGLVFVTIIGERASGRENAIAISALAGLGVVAFLVLGIVRALEGDGGATGLWRPIDVALSALVIGGFEGLLFGMVPLSGLPGASVKAWNTRVWAVLLFLGGLGFLHVIVNPSSGYLVNSSRTPLLKALVLLLGFGAISVGLWAWFRYRPMDRLRARSIPVATVGATAVAALPPPLIPLEDDLPPEG